ncbi:MAG: RNA polymerase sigma factor [Planctomycetaceae bacterium]
MSEPRPALAVSGLIREHSEFLYRYAYRLSGSVQDAEDLTQQTFLAAHRSLDQLREPERARAWLAAILRNSYRRSFRQAATGTVVPLDGIPEPVQEAPAEAPVDPEELQSALAELPEEYRTPLILIYLEHQGYREIAEALGIPIGTVMSRLSRGKAYLRQRLSRESVSVGLTSEKPIPRAP